MMPAAVREISQEDRALVDALRGGDEAAFLGLVNRLHGGMVRFALGFVRSEAAAEDVVQDSWAAVIEGLKRFEGRCALRTWIFGIVANQARTRATRDGRSEPLATILSDDEAAVDRAEFLPESHGRWAGHWAKWPEPWPDQHLLSREILGHIEAAISRLPHSQRAVIQLRDVEGLDSDEVCQSLGVSEGNQRVLLHRARTRVRREIARHVQERAS